MGIQAKPTRQKNVDLYEAADQVFFSIFQEMKNIGTRKQDATLSKIKVSVINKVLSNIKVMAEYEPEHQFLELLDDETLPQFGDAILIMAPYAAALRMFRARHYSSLTGWNLDKTNN